MGRSTPTGNKAVGRGPWTVDRGRGRRPPAPRRSRACGASDHRPRTTDRVSAAQAGFTLAAVMVIMAVMAIFLTVAVESVSFQQRREKEEELIFRGNQVVEAIRLFRARNGRFPLNLGELVKAKPRVLRKIVERPDDRPHRLGSRFPRRGGHGVRPLPGGLAPTPQPTPPPTPGPGVAGGEGPRGGPIIGVQLAQLRRVDQALRGPVPATASGSSSTTPTKPAPRRPDPAPAPHPLSRRPPRPAAGARRGWYTCASMESGPDDLRPRVAGLGRPRRSGPGCAAARRTRRDGAAGITHLLEHLLLRRSGRADAGGDRRADRLARRRRRCLHDPRGVRGHRARPGGALRRGARSGAGRGVPTPPAGRRGRAGAAGRRRGVRPDPGLADRGGGGAGPRGVLGRPPAGPAGPRPARSGGAPRGRATSTASTASASRRATCCSSRSARSTRALIRERLARAARAGGAAGRPAGAPTWQCGCAGRGARRARAALRQPRASGAAVRPPRGLHPRGAAPAPRRGRLEPPLPRAARPARASSTTSEARCTRPRVAGVLEVTFSAPARQAEACWDAVLRVLERGRRRRDQRR